MGPQPSRHPRPSPDAHRHRARARCTGTSRNGQRDEDGLDLLDVVHHGVEGVRHGVAASARVPTRRTRFATPRITGWGCSARKRSRADCMIAVISA